MKRRHLAWLCLATLGLASLACNLAGAAAPTEDLGTRVALALTGTTLAQTEAAAIAPYPLPEFTQTPAPTAAAATAAPTSLAPGTTATIGGKLCYPSEAIPPMTLYAREVNTQNTVSVQTAQNQGEYAIEVPAPGTYIVFAYADGGAGGTYSTAIACGLTVDCTDHAPIQMPVQPGDSVTDADLCDFYGPPGFIPPNPNPNTGTATIMGHLCYPSESIPPLTIYARETNTNQTFTIQTAQDQNEYSIDVPAPGTYILFAYTEGGIGGLYSQAVPCGLTVDCTDHAPIPVPVTNGATAQGVDICDYYGPEGSVPTP